MIVERLIIPNDTGFLRGNCSMGKGVHNWIGWDLVFKGWMAGEKRRAKGGA